MKKTILILIVIIPINLFGQFTKSFTNLKEYRFSNKLSNAVESKSYNYGLKMLDSILVYTENPDKSVINDGITCCLKTYKKNKLDKLLRIAKDNNYSLSSSKEEIQSIYPEFIKRDTQLFKFQIDSVKLFLIAEQLAQMFVDDLVCRGTHYQVFVDHSEKLGYKVSVNHDKPGWEVDSINTILLNSILAENPDLSKSDVGVWGMLSIFTIIQHSGKENLHKYSSLMDRWHRDGDIIKSDYALYTDRLLMYENKPQIYGTQITVVNDKTVFYEIENIDKIEEFRMKMGLMSIEKYASYFGINWNEYLQNEKE